MKPKQVNVDGSPEPGLERPSDPLERLIAVVQDEEGPDDVAVQHDHYLYGAPKD